jgi:hypothetical protein
MLGVKPAAKESLAKALQKALELETPGTAK